MVAEERITSGAAPLMHKCYLTHEPIPLQHEISGGIARNQMMRRQEDEQVRLKAQSCSAKERFVSTTVNVYDLVSVSGMYILSSSPSLMCSTRFGLVAPTLR